MIIKQNDINIFIIETAQSANKEQIDLQLLE